MAAPRASDPSLSAVGRLIAGGTRVLLRAPKLALAACGALAAAAVVYACLYLGFRTARHDLLSPSDPHNARWQDFRREFGGAEDAVVVVEGSDAAHLRPVLDELALRFAADDRHFQNVLHRIDLKAVRSKGLHYLRPADVAQVEAGLAQVGPILAGDWGLLNLGAQTALLNGALAAPVGPGGLPPETLAALKARLPHLVYNLHAAFLGSEPPAKFWPEFSGPLGELLESDMRYLLTADGRRGFVLFHPLLETGEFAAGTAAVGEARRILAEVAARHPEVSLGLTGLPVMENDEMQISQNDMNVANVVSLFVVALLFWAGFGGVRHALLGVVALLVGMAWSLGLATLVVGHLNLLSVAFGVVLIGLGIDFPIHYISCYLDRRSPQCDPRETLASVSGQVGPALLTGGLTTAAAFFATALTSFPGVVELGLISGGGILCCIAATFLVLPPLVYVFEREPRHYRAVATLQMGAALAPLYQRPRRLLLGTVAVTLAAAVGLHYLRYDHNLMKIQPKGVESVALEQKLLADSDQNAWFAISVANSPAEALARKSQFEKLSTVARVEEIASLVPAPSFERQAAIVQFNQQLAPLPEHPPLIPCESPVALAGQLERLRLHLLSGDESLRALEGPLNEVRHVLKNESAQSSYQRLAAYQQRLAHELLGRLHSLRGAASPAPPTLDDLPASLVTRFVSPRGKHVLRVYARGNIWDREALGRFIAESRTIDENLTGHPLQAYFASSQMQRSFLHAGIYAGLVVTILVVIDFGNLFHVMLSLIPLAASMVQMFGLLGWLGVPLNPANLIALPLIVGIGIDGGVHILHDYRRQPGPYRLGNSTFNSILLSSLTTTGSFGALLLARHQGLRTLGQVLAIGAFTCLTSCVLLLPALLSWLRQREMAQAAALKAAEGGGTATAEQPDDERPPDRAATFRIDAPAPLARPAPLPARSTGAAHP